MRKVLQQKSAELAPRFFELWRSLEGGVLTAPLLWAAATGSNHTQNDCSEECERHDRSNHVQPQH